MEKKVCRGEGRLMSLPSTYSPESCRILRIKLLRKQWDHPLLLVGCYLNLVFREMEFIEDRVKRSDHRSKAEEFARKLVRRYKEQQRRSNAASPLSMNTTIIAT